MYAAALQLSQLRAWRKACLRAWLWLLWCFLLGILGQALSVLVCCSRLVALPVLLGVQCSALLGDRRYPAMVVNPEVFMHGGGFMETVETCGLCVCFISSASCGRGGVSFV